MKRVMSCVLGAVLCVLGVAPRATAGEMWVSGFYVGYMASSYPPSAIDFSALTHVMVFSLLPRSDGTLDTTLFIDAVNGPAVAKDVAQRAHAAGRKAILVVGGEGTASAFRGATSPQYMSTFVQNLRQTAAAWGFDGIDIDWEPLASSDYAALLTLIGNLRAAQPGIALTADVPWLNANFPLGTSDAQFYAQLAGAVDQMNMMTYGMADNWPGWVAWHSSAVDGQGADHPSSVASSARMYMNAGVPAAKLGVGIGFFGSCWSAPVTGPLQSPGTARVVAGDNTMGFGNIKSRYYSDSNYGYDRTAEAPYLSFSIPTGPAGCTFISYEDERSVPAKASYAAQYGLGGASIWQLNEGYAPPAADPSSLLHAVGAAFRNVSPAPTSTRVGSSVQPSVFGQTVTFAAEVTSAAGTPGGTATFKDGSAVLGTAALAGGNAAITTSTLAAGSHAITAAYGGSATFDPSTSTQLNQVVNPAATSATLISSRNPSRVGRRITFTATVTATLPGTGTPTGTVRFLDGTALLGSVTVSAGKASFITSSLSKGVHAISAVYAGATNYQTSTSAILNQTVN